MTVCRAPIPQGQPPLETRSPLVDEATAAQSLNQRWTSRILTVITSDFFLQDSSVWICVFRFRAWIWLCHLNTPTALMLCVMCTYTQHIIRVGSVLGDFLKA